MNVFESRTFKLLAVLAAVLLFAAFLAGALARHDRRLWLLTAFSGVILMLVAGSALSKPKLLLRITPDGFQVFRKWELVNGQLTRTFSDKGYFFPWNGFSAVTVETRTARFVDNTKERVLRLKIKDRAAIDRSWSQDNDDPDFLVQASGQDVDERRLLQLFANGVRDGQVSEANLK